MQRIKYKAFSQNDRIAFRHMLKCAIWYHVEQLRAFRYEKHSKFDELCTQEPNGNLYLIASEFVKDNVSKVSEIITFKERYFSSGVPMANESQRSAEGYELFLSQAIDEMKDTLKCRRLSFLKSEYKLTKKEKSAIKYENILEKYGLEPTKKKASFSKVRRKISISLSKDEETLIEYLITVTADFHYDALFDFEFERQTEKRNTWFYDYLWLRRYDNALKKERVKDSVKATFPGREMDLMDQFIRRHKRMLEHINHIILKYCPTNKARTELYQATKAANAAKKCSRYKEAKSTGRHLQSPYSDIYFINDEPFPIRKLENDTGLPTKSTGKASKRRKKLNKWLQRAKAISDALEVLTRLKAKHDNFILTNFKKDMSFSERAALMRELEAEMKQEEIEYIKNEFKPVLQEMKDAIILKENRKKDFLT